MAPQRSRSESRGLLVAALAVMTFLAVDPLSFIATPIPRMSTRQITGRQTNSQDIPASGGLGLSQMILASGALALVGHVASGRRRLQTPPTACCFWPGGDKGKEGTEGEEEDDGTMSEAALQLQEEVEELKGHLEDKKEQHERLKMETSNYRTRTRKELSAARSKAAIPVFKELLPIADEFEMAKQNIKIEGDGEQAIADRFDKLFSGMLDTWKELGVDKLKAVGEDFNPELHEAVSMIPSEEYKADVVCNELRGGWALQTPGAEEPQVLRPSLVCVSAGPGPS